MPRLLSPITLTAAAACAAVAGPVLAGTITLNGVDSGWYRDSGYHSPSDESYAVGR